jgi:transitional endoplasmic reticulum ATPase
VLLYGPPGTGKTLLAKAIANEIQANFLVVKGPELLSKWFSESARMIRDLFRRARQLAPSIVFFDEIDALTPKRGGGSHSESSSESDRIINQLLALLDGIEAMKGVFVMGATNRPDVIDPALLRPGRLDRLIFIRIPTKDERKQILDVHTRTMHLASDVDLDKLATLTDFYTGADLESLCREAAFSTLRRNFSAREVTAADFLHALRVCRASVTAETLNYYKNLEKEMNNQRIMEYIRYSLQEYR